MKYIIALILPFILTFSANASEPIKVQYGLYAGGFNVAVIDATYRFGEDSYALEADLKTAGILGTLAPWEGDVVTQGRIEDGSLIPSKHQFISNWRGDEKTNLFTFDEEGKLVSLTKSESGEAPQDKMPSEEIYADNPADMLTALLSASRGESCGTVEAAMDDKRRFDMVFRSQGQDVLQPNRYSAFEGSAEICEVEIVPVAGKWRDKPRGWMNIQNQAKNKGQLPRLWFGQVRENMPAIAVRMLVKTDYGTMLMHLRDVK